MISEKNKYLIIPDSLSAKDYAPTNSLYLLVGNDLGLVIG